MSSIAIVYSIKYPNISNTSASLIYLRTYDFNELNDSSIGLKFREYRGSFTRVTPAARQIVSILSIR